MKRCLRLVLLILPLLLLTDSALAKQPWQQWVNDLRADAVADGIDGQFFDRVFADVRPRPRVINFDRRQPEKRITFAKYRSTRADAYRIKMGKQYYKRYKPLLDRIGKDFGVDPCFIVSFWGMESSYGNFMGSFPVIPALATLAYDARRADFFRKELILALHILQEGHVSPDKFKGEWAGGSGHPQFLPSSWHRYAVDYDGDGRKDIWESRADVFASIANYLVGNGWQTGQPWAITVSLPADFDNSLADRKNKRPVSYWAKLGVRPKADQSFPAGDTPAAIVMPYGGPALMTFKNFDVIMRYNNSTFYAGAIGYMADNICHRHRG